MLRQVQWYIKHLMTIAYISTVYSEQTYIDRYSCCGNCAAPSKTLAKTKYSQTWLESHCLQHQPFYNNTHGRNGFNGLCTKCPGYNYNNLAITAHFSGTKGVVVNKFDCTQSLQSVTRYHRLYTTIDGYIGLPNVKLGIWPHPVRPRHRYSS